MLVSKKLTEADSLKPKESIVCVSEAYVVPAYFIVTETSSNLK